MLESGQMILSFRLGKIVDYAFRKSEDPHELWRIFWRTDEPDEELRHKVTPLFSEWLIFEYKQKTGTTFIGEYYLKNPDNLNPKQLDQLRQVIQTETFELLEIEKVSRRYGWVIGYALFTGKRYMVYDFSFSHEARVGDVTWARLALDQGKYFTCGSDPFVYQIKFSASLKKHFLKMGKRGKFSLTDAVDIFLKPRSKNI